jgi:pimeloyl-ACP methyl ester carboxylesterase
VSFYGFMLQYLHFLKLALAPRDQVASDARISTDKEDNNSDVHLILGGYSYGSLMASHVPTLDTMLNLFHPTPTAPTIKSTPISVIRDTAKRIAASTLERLQVSHGVAGALDLRAWTTSISYLLVSPLLPPISQLLTMFSTLTLNVKTEIPQGPHILCPRPADQLSTHPVLALFGDQDNFTSAEKLQTWSDEMAHKPGSRFQFRMIKGAGHFWREHGVEEQARLALKKWLCQI